MTKATTTNYLVTDLVTAGNKGLVNIPFFH